MIQMGLFLARLLLHYLKGYQKKKKKGLIWCHLFRMRWEEFCQHLVFNPVRWVHMGIHSHLITCCHIYCCCLWTGTRRLGSGWREMLFSLQQMAQPWPAGDKSWWVMNGCSLPCFQQFPAERIRLSGKLELSPLGILFSRKISKQIASQFVRGSRTLPGLYCFFWGWCSRKRGREKQILQDFCTQTERRHQCQPTGPRLQVVVFKPWSGEEDTSLRSEWQFQSWMSLRGISFTWGGRIRMVAWKECSVQS